MSDISVKQRYVQHIIFYAVAPSLFAHMYYTKSIKDKIV